MSDKPEPIRILAHESVADRVNAEVRSAMNRRRFLGALGAGAAAAFLASCGDKVYNYYQSAPTASTLVDRRLRLYDWADYADPEVLMAWGEVDVHIYDSNEDLIAQLTATKGRNGFDVVCPTGMFIPEMVRRELLEQLDLSKIPNITQLDVGFVDLEWDRKNTYSVCKASGTIGWIYDSRIIDTPITNWTEFLAAAKGPGSGKTAIIDAPINSTGLYFWANGIDWTTESESDIRACEEFLLNELAPHLSALDSAPQGTVLDAPYALAQAYNGDARRCLLALQEAGEDTSPWKWAVGAPTTEKWMDNYCIVKGARRQDAAYDFINFMLDPLNAARQAMYVGNNTGTASLLELLPPNVPFKEMIFFTSEEESRMVPGRYHSKLPELIEIHTKLREKVSVAIPIKG
jgi:spermidine/putrescine transport system substrate-binding protein